MRRVGMLLTGALALAGRLAGQGQPQCSGLGAVQADSACNRAADAYMTFQPLAGMAMSGGNPVLGTGRALGGLGHFFVSARVNAVKAAVPNPDTTQQAVEGGVPAPVIEGGVGLFHGLSGGLLSVDALASAVLLPTGLDKLSVDADATKVGSIALGIGYGVRVGILNGAFPVPAISVSAMRRSLPRLRYGDVAQGDAFSFDSDLKATNVRVAASLQVVILDVAAGFGFDKYTSTGQLHFNNPAGPDSVTFDVDNSRQVLFANVGMNLALLKVVGELGYQTGKDQNLSRNYTDFDPKAGHVYGGLGVRFSF